MDLTAVICAVLASPILTKLIDALITKLSKKETQLDRIEKDIIAVKNEVNFIKMDQMRTNILLLLKNYPNSEDIPLLSKAYILKGGDSYVIPLIVDWYDSKGITYPE